MSQPMVLNRSKQPEREGRNERHIRLEEAARLAYSDASKTYRDDIWRQGIDHIAGMRRVPAPFFPSSLLGAQWTQIGPAPLRWQFFNGQAPVAGRVYDMAIDPSGSWDQTIYLATLGGIWKSVDGGASWAPKTDRLPWNQMSAVAIDPASPSVLYAGSIFSPGPSLFRSIDGGETWTVLATPALLGQQVQRIVVPSPGVVLVTTFINGLFRSVDGGVSFGNNPPLYNNNAAILSGLGSEVRLDTGSRSKIYACMDGQGIFVSTDGGASFPTNLFNNPGAPAPGTYFTITMAQSTQPDGQTLYASVSANFTTYVGLYKSTNGGASWALQPGAAPVAAASSQFGFTQTVGVDPQDAMRVYIGFENLWLSTDGGATFGATSVTDDRIHVDHHAVAFSPHWGPAPTRLYVGTDGGFAASPDGGTTWTNLNEGVATILVGQGALDIGRRSAANNQYSYVGTQDNGTDIRTPGLAGTDWQFSLGGDGSQVAVDTWDPAKAYAAANYFYEHTTTTGASWMGGAGPTSSVGALAVDPSAGANVYAAGGTPGVWADLLQSNDTGANFSLIHTFPQGIMCIAVDPSTSNQVWVGLYDGTIWRTDNALAGSGSTWDSYSIGLPSGRSAMSIAVDPSNSKRVVVGYRGVSGVPASKRSQHVYLTEDRGASWTDASGTDGGPPTSNLPDRPIYAVALDPGSSNSPSALIAGNDVGVLCSIDSGATWQILGVGLPNSRCNALALDWTSSPSLLRVGTYGRSVFELTTTPTARVVVESNLAFDRVAVGSSRTLIAKVYNVGSAPLTVNGFGRTSGSTAFASTGLVLPLTIAPGAEADFSLRFKPPAAGREVAVFQLTSTDPVTPSVLVPMSGFGAGTPVTQRPGFAYVGNYDNWPNNVYAYTIDVNGALKAVVRSPFVTSESGTSSATVDPSGQFIFVASGDIFPFAIDATGALATLPPTYGPWAADFLAVDPSGTFLFVAGSWSNNVRAFTIDTTGGLTAVPGSPFAAGTYPFSIAVDPSGKFVFVANQNSNNVSAFTIDSIGALHAVPGSPFAAGVKPVWVAVDPSGKFLLVANFSSDSISVFAIDATGVLTAVPGSPFAAGVSPVCVTVDPSGRFVFVANQNVNHVSGFTIDTAGALAAVPGSPFAAGTAPIAVTVDPSGTFVLVANQVSKDVSAFTMDATGALTAVAGSPFAAGTSPNWVITTFDRNPLVSIAVTPANSSLDQGLKVQFTATGTYFEGGTADLTADCTWHSSSPAIASISTTGLAQAMSPGSTTISATLGSVKGSTGLSVVALVSIAVTPANSSLAEGLTAPFAATGTYANGTTADLTAIANWLSSKPSVASISVRGGVAAVYAASPGTTTISATLGMVGGSTGLTVYLARIAFTSTRTGNPQIYVMNPDGGGQIQLTTNRGIDTTPSWSPAQMKIAYSATTGSPVGPLGQPQIFTMNADGTGVTQLTNSGQNTTPAWSPDGSKIAFTSTRDGNPQLYVMKSDGSGQVRITKSLGSDTTPSWSPDGKRIAFSRSTAGSPTGPSQPAQILAMNADGTHITQLTRSAQNTTPAWSPDGTKIAFSSTRDGDPEIYIMNSNGSGQLRLTKSRGIDTTPSWSPDGKKIAFSSTRTRMAQIFSMNADGTGVTELTTARSGQNTTPAWASH
jgi:Tol biopolymer transport system component/6-phosphogluconolactonase (cycloisomerase 2 family)